MLLDLHDYRSSQRSCGNQRLSAAPDAPSSESEKWQHIYRDDHVGERSIAARDQRDQPETICKNHRDNEEDCGTEESLLHGQLMAISRLPYMGDAFVHCVYGANTALQ